MKTIRIFDTTLRDGEQSPGASLNHNEKIEIARQLDTLGVDVIEAGFPITSKGDFDAVHAISMELERPIVCALSRSVIKDVDAAGKSLADAACPARIHVFCATSKIHREHKLKKAFDEVIRISTESITHARGYVDDVEFSPEDGSRTELNYLVDITAAAIEAGATTINIPDTVGYATPDEYGHIFAYVREKLPIIDKQGIFLSSHCHDDLGLAVANSLAAIENGARQVECTINGIGERAGNASLEEIVMAIKTRSDFYKNYQLNINTKKLYPTSRMVSQLTNLDIQRNKAIVGQNAFAHESGVHQDGMIKNRHTYEIMTPPDVGIPESKLVLGKHSGRHALTQRIETLGYTLDSIGVERIYDAFKELADKKKNIYDEDIEILIENELNIGEETEIWHLENLQVTTGNNTIPTATITISDQSGTKMTDAAIGDGPIDAIYTAISDLTKVSVVLLNYRINAVTEGGDAQGEVLVELDHHGKRIRGRGVSTDVIEASAKAYLAAINRIKTLENRANINGLTQQP